MAPMWNKVVVSGSNAELNQLTVTNNITAATVSGSFSGSLTGQVIGTSSWADNSVSSSYVPITAIAGTTFSNTAFLFPDNLTVGGTLVAEKYLTEYITSSVIFESGSTKFGDTVDDVHQFTGSLLVNGIISGNLTLPTGVVSSSTQAVDWAVLSSSYAPNLYITSSIAAPTNPSADQLWYDETTGKSYIYYVSASVGSWVLQSDPTYEAPTVLLDLQDVTNLGSTTTEAISILNGTVSNTTSSGALIVSGGVGIGGTLNVNLANISRIIGNLTGSATTASFVSFANVGNKPAGLISSSTQALTWTVLSASYAETASFVSSASFAVSASYVSGAASDWNTLANKPLGLVSSSTQVDYTQIQNKPTIIPTASYVEFTNIANKPALVSSSEQVSTGSFTGSFVGELIGTGSWAINAVTASYVLPTGLPSGTVSSSTQVDYTQIQNKPTTIPTASYVQFANIANKPVLVSSSTQFTDITAPFTGSFTGSFRGLVTQSNIDAREVVVRDYLELYPTTVTITPDEDSAYFYISGSNNDLWYTHKQTSTVNFNWIEGVLETGLLYGGIEGFSGSNVYIREGAGIIVSHNAVTSSLPEPTINYVTWNAQTSSIDVTQGFVTYLSIDASGIVQSSSTKFSPLDYNEKIPLGAVGHFNNVSIAAKGDLVNTQYGQLIQASDFARNFGPIKVGGFGINPQSGSLRFSRSSGDAFIYGGFYSQNPETPSNFQGQAVSTGSIAYLYRSGSTFTVDANNNNFYTVVKPGFYDDGSGTTASLASNEWSIQRVFLEPVTGIHYIYLGQSKYTSLVNAVSNILTDTFTEGPATTLFTVFIGYLIMKGDTIDLGNTLENSVLSAGLFRNTSAGSVGGGAAAQLLNDLSDVSVITPSTGQALVYNAGTWTNGTPQNAVSASYAPYQGLRSKSGAVLNTSFSGSPKKATVTFADAFPNTSYAVTITGEDARSWTIENKGAGSFVINSNSNISLNGNTYWIAAEYGET